MSRESKIINGAQWGVEKTIYNYESFGWELLSLNGSQITMSRETQNPVYTDLVKYQAKYEAKLVEYASIKNPAAPKGPIAPPPIRAKVCFWSFVLGVIPCVVYVTYKLIQKNKYKQALADHATSLIAHKSAIEECDAKRKAILAEIDQITMDSRATFFAKHE